MKRKDIHLQVPRSWNECSTEQLEQLSELAIRREMSRQLGMDSDMSEREYHMRAFLLLAGLKPHCRTEFVDGEAVYWFPLRRSSWWKNVFCRKILVPIRAWEMKEWCEKHLSWLDDPYNRLKSPYTDVRIGGFRILPFAAVFGRTQNLRCLNNRMVDATYRQYVNIENILKQYWLVQSTLKKLSESNASSDAIKNQLHNLDILRRMFLATILSPAVRITQEDRNGQIVKCEKVSYQFDEAQISENKDRFTSSQVNRMFPVLLQFYLSVQRYFSTLYPNLYVSRDNEDGSVKIPDFIRLEIESMSTIMKYQGFASYREIYDSDAVHVLKVLDHMADEAKKMQRFTTNNIS